MNLSAASGLLSNREAAAYLGVRPQTLKKWRCKTYKKRHRIPFLRVGRLIKYRQSDLLSWVNSREEAG
jgi:excisionase family DNA binding protein